MTASQVGVGDWFMIIRTKAWYQKIDTGKTYTSAKQIGDTRTHMVINEEPVIIRK